MSMTAAELMAKLQRDKEFLAKKKLKAEELGKLQIMFDEDQAEMLLELSRLGYELESVWDFVGRENNYMNAVPILKNHLEKEHHPKILSGIARALAISSLSDDDELWELLVNLYKTTPPDSHIALPVDRGAQESIAAALRVLANPSRAATLKSLILKFPEGDGVFHFQNRLDEINC